MGLNPTAQETGRHGHMDSVAVDAFELETGKPARENVLTDLRAQAFAYPPPLHVVGMFRSRFGELRGHFSKTFR